MATVFEVMSAFTDLEKITAQMKSRRKFDGLDELEKKPMTLLGLEPSTFRLVARRLNHLCAPNLIVFLISSRIKF
jgi:hypothetical protein